MFPREYLPTQGLDDSSTAGVFQYTVLYHTILYKMFLAIAAISKAETHRFMVLWIGIAIQQWNVVYIVDRVWGRVGVEEDISGIKII